jgi:hypothetical protein
MAMRDVHNPGDLVEEMQDTAILYKAQDERAIESS